MRRIKFLLIAVFFVSTCLGITGIISAATTKNKLSKVILPAATMNRLRPLVNKNLIFLTDAKTNNLTYLSKIDDKIYLQIANFSNAAAAGKQFLKEYAKYFGAVNYIQDLKLQKQTLDMRGTTHLLYQQYYKNIPVFGGQLLIHMAGDFGIKSAGGKFLPAVLVNTKPVLNKTKATNAALADAKKRGLQSPGAVNAALAVYNPRGLNPKGENKYYLTWQIELEDAAGWREILFVNAANGKIIQNLALTKTIDFSEITDNVSYDTDNMLYQAFGSDILQRRVYDCQLNDGCTASSTADRVVVHDPVGMRSEGDPAYRAFELDELYSELGKAHNYYKDTFGLNGGNGFGGIGTIANERHPANRTDAYAYFVGTSTWGYCPNAWGGKGSLKFCRGAVNTPAVGHEYTHAVSDFVGPPTSSLVYLNESGAIEEAIADVLGQGVERYSAGTSSWQIGANGVIWRDFSNPNNPLVSRNRQYPSNHYDTEFKCDAADKGGVHTNSMVIAHMAYILSTGGQLNGCMVEAIGQDKVEQMLFDALDNRLTISANFQELYGALTDSCRELYGLESATCVNLIQAMQAVELDQPGACVVGIKEYAPLCRVVKNDIEDNNYVWRRDSLQEINFKKTIDLSPVIDPILTPDNDVLTSPDAGANSGSEQSSSGDANTTPITPVTPPATPVVEKEVRVPSFTVVITQDDNDVTVQGKINYYGKGSSCSGPRPYDPVIVRWGDGADEPKVLADGSFSAKHAYYIKNKSYNLTVSVYNSCYGVKTENKTIILN